MVTSAIINADLVDDGQSADHASTTFYPDFVPYHPFS
jgi:hypothetical protein